MRAPSRFPIPAAFLTCLALLLGAARVDAQTAGVEGTVIDSLRSVPLAGAFVQIGQISRRFPTDSAGRFRADSLPAGPQTIRFGHPVLDSLGMSGPSVTVELRADTTIGVALGTPSGRTFLAHLCRGPGAADRRSEGRSAVLGVVRATDSDGPVPGAAVQLQWASVVADKVLGIRRKVDILNAVTDSTGLYFVCDAPADIDAALTVAAAGYDTAVVELHLEGESAAVQHVMLAPLPAPGTAQAEPPATLTGIVRDEEGKPLEGAEVVLVTRYGAVTRGPARTDAAGRYTLRDAPAGTRMAEVRRVGSSPVRRTITLASARPTRLDVTLTTKAIELAEVSVTAESRLDKNGFTLRRGIGQGRFYTDDDVARQAVTVSGDFLGQIPGMQVDGNRVINRSLRQTVKGATCEMATFLNGTLTPTDYVLNIPKENIDGVEVYETGGKVPVEFARPEAACGAIMIWTKQPQ
jgi:hypothetical protein